MLDSLLVSGNTVKIIEKLGAKLYKKVDEVLRTIGGKWNTGAGVHIFEDDPALLIEEITSTGSVYTWKDFEFFETQEEECNRAIVLADLEDGHVVMEPSAGGGALALKAASIVGKQNVICYELMERNLQQLRKLGFTVSEPVDFLAVEPSEIADRVVMNPPFSNRRDIAHIQHAYAFLKPGGKLVAIASTQWQVHDNARSKAFRKWLEVLNASVEQIESGAFKAVGTSVPTALIYLTKPIGQAAAAQKTAPSKVVAPQPVQRQVETQADLFAA